MCLHSKLTQEAQDNWPEDEAHAFYADWVRPDPDTGETLTPEAIERQRAHVHAVFNRVAPEDAESLINRFEAEVSRLTTAGVAP